MFALQQKACLQLPAPAPARLSCFRPGLRLSAALRDVRDYRKRTQQDDRRPSRIGGKQDPAGSGTPKAPIALQSRSEHFSLLSGHDASSGVQLNARLLRLQVRPPAAAAPVVHAGAATTAGCSCPPESRSLIFGRDVCPNTSPVKPLLGSSCNRTLCWRPRGLGRAPRPRLRRAACCWRRRTPVTSWVRTCDR